MSWQALALVVSAAFLHALWNFHAKRAASAGTPFLVLSTSLSAIVYAPFALWQLATTSVSLGLVEVGSILGSVALHSVYLFVLQRGYVVGDLSIVYPVARGLGPVFTITGAMIFLHERPSAQVLVGGLVVCAAVISLGFVGARGSPAGHETVRALGFASLTGVAIACYTLWDAHAVSALAIAPLLFTWSSSLVRLAILSPVAWRRHATLWDTWRRHRRDVIAVATLAPLAYLLVLNAFTMAPVSNVAPVREIGIVIATALGTHLLGEGHQSLRLAVAATVLCGVVMVVTGH